MPVYLILIVEDSLSQAVARKILQKADKNYEIKNVLHWNKDKIGKKIRDINKAAQGHVYFVLTDQDTEDRCPPDAINELSDPLHTNLLYRFAVMETESWVMAHREGISKFFSIPLNRVPLSPDSVSKPKECMVNLARRSRLRQIKEDIVPKTGSTSKVGPNYNGRMIKFVTEHWDIEVASQSSQSLKRAFEKLKGFSPVGISGKI